MSSRAAPRLEAGRGLTLVLADDGWRIAWHEPDWWGPVALRLDLGSAYVGPASALTGDERRLEPRLEPFDGHDDLGLYHGLEVHWQPAPLALRTSVRAYETLPLLVFRAEAAGDLAGLATGSFAQPSLAWPFLQPAQRLAGGVPEGTRAFGHQYTEFALPTVSDASLESFFLLGHRPAVVEPLWLVAPDGRTLMLAPLDAFHEQVVAVPEPSQPERRGLRCGWQGDLDAVPRGFASELGVWAADGPRRALDAWAGALRRRHHTERPSRYADPGLARLSYWTDNGAAYWYRSEPGCDVPTTLERVAEGLRSQHVPVGCFQLDSWFYPHEKSRPLATEDGMAVPPTGLLRWEPRADLLPDGVDGLRRRLGDPPLILHCRHFSSRSPYFETHDAWLDGDRAHPRDRALFDRLLGQAAAWGAVTFEQDWLVESFLGVRGLRERPGRARAWQQQLDRAAAEHGVTLQWCMASPADFFETASLRQVTSIRTSGDYRYLIGSQSLWAWFLYTNALARALGLHPYKDVFLSRADGSGRDGDPHCEVEALLAALSTGPVGIGDRVGRTDRALLLRTCRIDGVLVKPDVPLAALERCFRAHAHLAPEPLLAEAYSSHPAGRWHYLVALHAWRGKDPIRFRLELRDLGDEAPDDAVVVYDWRRGRFERLAPDGGFEGRLAHADWDFRVLCPLLPGGLALVGDAARYATAGDRRLRDVRAIDGGLACDVLGAPGEAVELRGWSERPLASLERWSPERRTQLDRIGADAPAREGYWHDATSGAFGVRVTLDERGWLELRVRC